MTTPAQVAGFVIGKAYRMKAGNDEGWPEDTIVTFRNDDGTDYPSFFCPEHLDSDGWRYIRLGDIKDGALPVKEADAVFSVTVLATQTTIVIGKPLTVDQVAAVLKIAGV